MPSCGCLLLVWVEHLVDRQAEEPRDRERQRQRRQVTAALDGDHRLARHAQRRRQLGLRHLPLGALLPDPVPHDVKVPLHDSRGVGEAESWGRGPKSDARLATLRDTVYRTDVSTRYIATCAA